MRWSSISAAIRKLPATVSFSPFTGCFTEETKEIFIKTVAYIAIVVLLNNLRGTYLSLKN
ncbi:hypothetical protein ABEF79_00030 [Acinetobacter sp. ANC 7454]|uniref:hypothetical protein n=1 Tax=Acinetobacter thermotolerans TaxID=3151487 RepID=UPI00325B6422